MIDTSKFRKDSIQLRTNDIVKVSDWDMAIFLILKVDDFVIKVKNLLNNKLLEMDKRMFIYQIENSEFSFLDPLEVEIERANYENANRKAA